MASGFDFGQLSAGIDFQAGNRQKLQQLQLLAQGGRDFGAGLSNARDILREKEQDDIKMTLQKLALSGTLGKEGAETIIDDKELPDPATLVVHEARKLQKTEAEAGAQARGQAAGRKTDAELKSGAAAVAEGTAQGAAAGGEVQINKTAVANLNTQGKEPTEENVRIEMDRLRSAASAGREAVGRSAIAGADTAEIAAGETKKRVEALSDVTLKAEHAKAEASLSKFTREAVIEGAATDILAETGEAGARQAGGKRLAADLAGDRGRVAAAEVVEYQRDIAKVQATATQRVDRIQAGLEEMTTKVARVQQELELAEGILKNREAGFLAQLPAGFEMKFKIAGMAFTINEKHKDQMRKSAADFAQQSAMVTQRATKGLLDLDLLVDADEQGNKLYTPQQIEQRNALLAQLKVAGTMLQAADLIMSDLVRPDPLSRNVDQAMDGLRSDINREAARLLRTRPAEGTVDITGAPTTEDALK